jgi:Tfp pilus assembly protein PilF
MEESLREGLRAVALDSASVSICRSMGWLYYFARQEEAAVAQLHRALIMNPESHETHLILALANVQLRQLDAAETAVREALTLNVDDTAALAAQALLHMLRGREADAHGIEQRMHALARERYVSPADFAKLYLALGNADRVFEWMERAYEGRRGWLAYLRVEPLLDPLRSDPRLGLFLERLRLGG